MDMEINFDEIVYDESDVAILQLETATGQVIQLPEDLENHTKSESQNFEKNDSESEQDQQDNVDLSFACTLCKRRFSRKLHLNNHMESHHGIKYVFTEKGRKVKLVRIPEGFKVVEGEKLDPCVEKLITTIDKDQLHRIIGVEEIEPDEPENKINNPGEQQEDEQEDSNHLADLLNGKTESSFGCGFLFQKINYHAYQVTVTKKETPFAVFYPPDQNTVYLFRILDAGETQHLFLPATKKDVRSALEGRTGADSVNYTIPLVAALRLTEDLELPMRMMVEPLPAEKPTKVELMSFEEFLTYARRCQGSVVKSLADSIEVSPSPARPPIIVDAAPKQKRKFQRRTTRAILKAESMITGQLPQNENLTDAEGTAVGNLAVTPASLTAEPKPKKSMAEAKIQKLRRNLKKEFDEEVDDGDDEEKDASYCPTGKPGPKKRGRGRPPGTKNKPKV